MINTINDISCMWWDWMAAMFWQVGLLILFVACIDLLIKRWAWPQLRYALWLMILVKLILPPGISMHGSLTERVKPKLDWLISYNIEGPSTIENYSSHIISSDSIVAFRQMVNQQPQVVFTPQKFQSDVFVSSALESPETLAVRLI